MRKWINKVICVVLVLAIALPMQILADESIIDHDNTGSGSSGIQTGTAFTWTTLQSGYRFTIVNSKYETVANVVDLVFSEPNQDSFGNGTNYYINGRNIKNNVSRDRLAEAEIRAYYCRLTTNQLLKTPAFGKSPSSPAEASIPPLPITIDNTGKAVGNGAAFKEWFMRAEQGITSSQLSSYTPTYSNGGYSNNSSGSSASTSKPKIKDIQLSSLDSLFADATKRQQVLMDATKALKDANLLSDADAELSNQKAKTYAYAKINTTSHDMVEDAYYELMVNSNTYAEVMYITIKLINMFYGDNYSANIRNMAASNEISIFEKIPLATATKDDGYADDLLNLKLNDGSNLFNFIDTELAALQSSGESVTDIMCDKGLFVIVEPIFWFKPSAYSSTAKCPVLPAHTNYIYGTVNNIAKFYRDMGYPAFGASYSTGGAYSTLIGNIGYRCMTVGQSVKVSDSLTISAFNTESQISLANLNSLLDTDKGAAMHIYSTIPREEIEEVTLEIIDKSPFSIGQSSISTALSIDDIDEYSGLSMTFKCDDYRDSGVMTAVDSRGKTVTILWSTYMQDGNVKYIVENAEFNKIALRANISNTIFSDYWRNNELSLVWPIGGGERTLGNLIYKMTLWRGNDLPTLASYKVSDTDVIRNLIPFYDKVPANKRADNGSYSEQLSIRPSLSNKSDTKVLIGYTPDVYPSFEKETKIPQLSMVTKDINVYTYRGNESKKDIGNEFTSGLMNTFSIFGNVKSSHSTGFMMQNTESIKFYPYIRMTYQGSNTAKYDTYVLSEQQSEIMANDFIEVGWYSENEDESMLIQSNQWSTHARATKGSSVWQGKNQVLPGGALYTLTNPSKPTQVGITSWQTIITGNERASLSEVLPGDLYTKDSAVAAHTSFVKEAKEVIEKLRVSQWVTADVNAKNAWDNGIEVTGGGIELSKLGLKNKTSSDIKYQLLVDSSKNMANEGDIDIISESGSTVYFKVFADTSGDIWLAICNGSISLLDNINGQNTKSNSSSVTVKKILSKTVKWQDVGNKLTDKTAIELDTKTKVITNLVKALERNTGKDFLASWATNDGTWYNEAWDGIIVIRLNTILTIGFNKPEIRTAVLDPALCPTKSGTSNIFTKAFMSQFRLRSQSDAAINKDAGYIGTFKGQDVILKDMELMMVSKKFYIPNANVTDLD